MGHPAHLLKPESTRPAEGRRDGPSLESARSPVTVEQQALYLNAIPLVVLGLAYLVAAATLVPVFYKERERVRDLELALALVFPCGGAAALIFGILVLRAREPVGGAHAWIGLFAILLALGPAIAFFWRFRDRSLLLTAPSRMRAAEERTRLHEAATLEDAGRAVADRAAALVDVEVGSVMLVNDEGTEAWALAVRENGVDAPWSHDARLDLVNEPSGVASAYHDAAPFAVYDARGSTRVSARLVERAGSQSIAYVPMLTEQRVIGVIVAACTSRQRAFTQEELAALQGLAADAAPVIERLRGAPGRAGRARAHPGAARAELVRAEIDVDVVLANAVEQVAVVLDADRVFVRLGEGGALSVRAEWHAPDVEPIGDGGARLVVSNLAARDRRVVAIDDVATSSELEETPVVGRQTLLELGSRAVLAVPVVVFDRMFGVLGVHRQQPGEWSAADVSFVEAVARELGFGLQTAQLLGESDRRLERQTALLQAAQALTSELDFERVLERLVDEVVVVVGADAADCWLFDDSRRLLHCRAVRGLPESELGRAISPEGTIGDVIARRTAVLRRDFAHTEQPPPSESYRAFAEVMDAPIVVHGEVRGVLGTCSLTANRFSEADLELLDAFASLASLALRNAEAFEERSRQAQIQRGFYRIASVLGEPLSLSATFDALAQAAGEAFGARFAVAVAPRGDAFEVLGSHAAPAGVHEALHGRLAETGELLRYAAEERRIVASAGVAEDARFSARWRGLGAECGFDSLLVVPVSAPREDVAALVLVFFDARRALRDGDLELAHHLAQAAHGSLQRSELFDAERRSRTLAQQLARTGGVVATELDPAAVLDEVVAQGPEIVGADGCLIATADGTALVVVAASGAGSELALGAQIDGSRLVAEIIQSRSPVSVEDIASDPSVAAADPFVASGYSSYLGVPLIGTEGSLHGVLSVYGQQPRAWRAEEVEALLALAANTSGALSNAELYQRVALEKERSNAILENIADGIVAVDREGNVVLWNRAAEEVTGVPASEATGRDPQQLLGRTLSGAALVPILRGGGEIWLSVTEAVMRDPAGAVAGRIFAFRDISAERLVEQMKSEFVATVSHELRGPLTSIYGFAETLLREDVLFGDEERKVFLGYVASEAGRLTEIVDALLSVARLESGDLQVELAPTDVAPLVNDVVSTVGENGTAAHDFIVELPSEPLAAEADADKLRHVLAQLVDNAVKYSPRGGRVTVAARRNRDTVEFHVADEGIGIPEAERERIFRKFYRADQDRGGTGLGLFLAEGYVKAMGGRIWVESAEGEGSRFAFELPAARV